MSISFRPGIRENVGLLVGLAGASGSGKTYTAMRLASGIAGGKPFAFVDTEARRGLHYADAFKFDHAELHSPFRPDAYADAIQAADEAGYPVIVVDSMTHEWAGEGGVLDWQEDELDRMAGQDWAKRERVKMAAWIAPKKSHKMMVQKLLQVKAHLILCFRAEEKLEMSKDVQGKTVIAKKAGVTGLDGWFPICEKNLPYELTASFLLMAARPGIPLPIKLQEQHKKLFPLDKPITEESGRLIAQWAAGSPALPTHQEKEDMLPAGTGAGNTASDAAVITADQCASLETKAQDGGVPLASLRKAAGVERPAQIAAKDYERADKWLDAAIAKRKAT